MSETLDTAQIAQMLGITREYVTDNLTKRSGFPAPSVNLSQKLRRWKASEVNAWIVQRSRPAMSAADSR